MQQATLFPLPDKQPTPEPESKDINAPCPKCGAEKPINIRAWKHTFNDDWYWDGHEKKHRRHPGPDSEITCLSCMNAFPARDWHRVYERREIERAKQVTPSMQKQRAISG